MVVGVVLILLRDTVVKEAHEIREVLLQVEETKLLWAMLMVELTLVVEEVEVLQLVDLEMVDLV